MNDVRIKRKILAQYSEVYIITEKKTPNEINTTAVSVIK